MDELTLILNAAEKRLQFILLQDEILLHAEESEPQKNGTDPLLSHINHACRQLGTHPNRIKKIAATAGPGNFMGIRLTAAIAGAFCRANNGMQASINYMQALAYNYFAKEKEIIHIVTTGTRELVHSQCFQYINGMAQTLQEIRLIPFEQLAGIPCEFCCGSGIRTEKVQEILKNHGCALLPSSFDSPSINSLLQCLKTVQWQKEDISPLYLKECDAVQNLPHIAELQGRNPEESRQELERLLKA